MVSLSLLFCIVFVFNLTNPFDYYSPPPSPHTQTHTLTSIIGKPILRLPLSTRSLISHCCAFSDNNTLITENTPQKSRHRISSIYTHIVLIIVCAPHQTIKPNIRRTATTPSIGKLIWLYYRHLGGTSFRDGWQSGAGQPIGGRPWT